MAIFPQGLSNIDKRCANAGERAVLHQLKRCLSDDYMVRHDVPMGPKARQPDCVVLAAPHMNEPMDEEVRLLYVGMTRATHELVLSAAGSSPMLQRVKNSMEVVARQFAAG